MDGEWGRAGKWARPPSGLIIICWEKSLVIVAHYPADNDHLNSSTMHAGPWHRWISSAGKIYLWRICYTKCDWICLRHHWFIDDNLMKGCFLYIIQLYNPELDKIRSTWVSTLYIRRLLLLQLARHNGIFWWARPIPWACGNVVQIPGWAAVQTWLSVDELLHYPEGLILLRMRYVCFPVHV